MGVNMKLIENLFGEFIDLALSLDPTNIEVPYRLIGGHSIGGHSIGGHGHSIGFWLFIGIICAGMIACIFSKKFRSKFF